MRTRGADLDRKTETDYEGYNALMIAFERWETNSHGDGQEVDAEFLSIIRLLVEVGADIYATDALGREYSGAIAALPGMRLLVWRAALRRVWRKATGTLKPT